MGDPLGAARSLMDVSYGVDLVEMLGEEPAASPLADVLREIADGQLETNMIGPDGVIQAKFHGVDGYLAAWRDWTSPFRSFAYRELEAPIVKGNEIVSFVIQRGVIGESGHEVTAEGSAVWRFNDDGRLCRIDFHLDREQALRAVGLSAPSKGART